MPLPRAKKKLLSEYKALLRVDVDWCSSGIWEISEPKQRTAGKGWSAPDGLVPEWLRQRFDYWGAWHCVQDPRTCEPAVDYELFKAYGFSLAIDLKRVLGDDYYIEYGGREIQDDCAYLREQMAKKGKKAR